ncbi:Uncharacterized protein Adt_09711 [Abeliophyllum distichum]|uniref:Uncharacterized protein n=1 Tax=Abeliophyllum distichum TaxID=126358 RepID=A0ABD1UI27_9LAMI
MGNCMANETPNAEEIKQETPKKAKTTSRVVDITNPSKPNVCRNAEENCSKMEGKAVRLRFVLTQTELNQILNGEFQQYSSSSSSSSHQLLNALQLTSRRIDKDGFVDDNVNGNWRPDLETIPEEY